MARKWLSNPNSGDVGLCSQTGVVDFQQLPEPGDRVVSQHQELVAQRSGVKQSLPDRTSRPIAVTNA